MTFKEWLAKEEEYQEIFSEVEEIEAMSRSARRKFMQLILINACAVFFPDLPEIEGRILAGVRSF